MVANFTLFPSINIPNLISANCRSCASSDLSRVLEAIPICITSYNRTQDTETQVSVYPIELP